jgi:hypothetical protein
MHFPQDRANEQKMKLFKQVEAFYGVWHPRIFTEKVWKRMNDGAVPRVHAPCL